MDRNFQHITTLFLLLGMGASTAEASHPHRHRLTRAKTHDANAAIIENADSCLREAAHSDGVPVKLGNLVCQIKTAGMPVTHSDIGVYDNDGDMFGSIMRTDQNGVYKAGVEFTHQAGILNVDAWSGRPSNSHRVKYSDVSSQADPGHLRQLNRVVRNESQTLSAVFQ